MKHIAIVLSCLLFATCALAQIDPHPDGIGIYADLEGTEVSIQAEVGEIFPVYLLMTRPSTELGIASWAAMVVAPLNCQILAWNIQGGPYLSYASPPEFTVCFTEYPSPQPIMHLLTFYCQMTNEYPGYFRVVGAPINGPPFDEAPCYLVEDDFETPHFMHGYPNGIGEPMFAVNDDLTPVNAMSLTSVKSLFQ